MRLFWGLLPEMMRWNWFVVHDGLWIISSLICLWFYIWMFSSCEVLCYSIFLTWLIWCELSCCRSRRQTQTYLLSLILLLFFLFSFFLHVYKYKESIPLDNKGLCLQGCSWRWKAFADYNIQKSTLHLVCFFVV